MTAIDESAAPEKAQARGRWQPLEGFCIVKRVEPGQTAAGLHVPAIGQTSYRYYLVAASRGHAREAVFVECKLRPGDEVLIFPRPVSIPGEKGAGPRIVEMLVIQPLPDEPNHFLADLKDIHGRRQF